MIQVHILSLNSIEDQKKVFSENRTSNLDGGTRPSASPLQFKYWFRAGISARIAIFFFLRNVTAASTFN